MNQKNLTVIGVVVVAFLVLFVWMGPFYLLQEGEQAAVTQFGELVGVEEQAGLKVKVPGIQNITIFPRRLLSWDGDPQIIPTKENQLINVDVTARWKIKDLKKFYPKVITLDNANKLLAQVIDPNVRGVVSNSPLIEVIRNSNNMLSDRVETKAVVGSEGSEVRHTMALINQEYEKINEGRRKLSADIFAKVKGKAMDEYGIEVVDILIKQIRYPDDLVEPVYNRMIAERKQEAASYRSDGEGQKNEILGKTEKEKKTLMSESTRKAEEIRGKADAEAASIYAQAYQQDPEFYAFWKAIQSYKETLPGLNKTLTTDADYFRYLYSPRGR